MMALGNSKEEAARSPSVAEVAESCCDNVEVQAGHQLSECICGTPLDVCVLDLPCQQPLHTLPGCAHIPGCSGCPLWLS